MRNGHHTCPNKCAKSWQKKFCKWNPPISPPPKFVIFFLCFVFSYLPILNILFVELARGKKFEFWKTRRSEIPIKALTFLLFTLLLTPTHCENFTNLASRVQNF